MPLLPGTSSPAAVRTILTNAVFDVLTHLSEQATVVEDCRRVGLYVGSLLHLQEAAVGESPMARLADLLPSPPALVIDIGSCTGRDAGAYAAASYDVFAVEPSAGMGTEAPRLHPSSRIRRLPDSLPALATVGRLGLSADVVLLSAVWQHVASVDRPRNFRKLVGLRAPGGFW